MCSTSYSLRIFSEWKIGEDGAEKGWNFMAHKISFAVRVMD